MLKKIVIGIFIIGAIGGMIAFNLFKGAGTEDGSDKQAVFKGKSISVTAERLVAGEISSSVLVSGAVEEVTMKNVILASPLEIQEVLVENGSEVKSGDVLFTADLSAMEDELAQTKITYDIQNLQLQKLQTMSSNTASAQIGVELAKLALASAQRAYDNQLELLEKNAALLEEGIITQSEYDGLNSGIEEAQSSVESATLSLSRSRTEIANSKDTTSIDIQVQVKNLESLDMTVAKLEKKINDIQALMKAPMTGVVTKVNMTEGETSQAMTPLITITDIEDLKVVAYVREYDVKNIGVGQLVLLTGDAIPQEALVKGEVTYIAPIAEKSMVNGRETTAVEIEIAVTEGESYLKPGYITDCEVMTEVKSDVVMADYTMFRDDKDNNKVVFLVHDDGRIEERIIKLGITSDFDAEVVEGLEVGDVVITSPSLTVKDGMKAEITNELDGESTSEGE